MLAVYPAVDTIASPRTGESQAIASQFSLSVVVSSDIEDGLPERVDDIFEIMYRQIPAADYKINIPIALMNTSGIDSIIDAVA